MSTVIWSDPAYPIPWWAYAVVAHIMLRVEFGMERSRSSADRTLRYVSSHVMSCNVKLCLSWCVNSFPTLYLSIQSYRLYHFCAIYFRKRMHDISMKSLMYFFVYIDTNLDNISCLIYNNSNETYKNVMYTKDTMR